MEPRSLIVVDELGHGRVLRWRSSVVAALCSAGMVAAMAAPAQSMEDLTALSLEQLLDLRVMGASKYQQKQGEVAAAVSVITRQEIRAFGWRTLDEALASLPGVHTTYDRQYSYVGLRGFGLPGDYNTRLLVTINGNRLNDAVYDQAYLGRELPLDLAFVERIEFIPGPGGAVHGQNAMFGVVNIITRGGSDLAGGEVALSYQRPQAQRELRLGWGRVLGDGTDVMFAVSGLRAAGEDRFYTYGASGVRGVAAGMDGERDAHWMARAARGAWSVDAVWGDRRKDDPTATNQSVPLMAGQYQADRMDLLQWQHQSRLDETRELMARLFIGRSRFNGAFNFDGWFYGKTASQWHGVELRMLDASMASHKLMLGVEAQRTSRADQAVYEQSAPDAAVFIRSPGTRMGLYVQDEWRLVDALSVTLGLRIDHNDRDLSVISPRAGLIWQITPANSLKALVGRAHRAPNAYERDYGDGVTQSANPTLGHESIDTCELVAERRLPSSVVLKASAYHWTMTHLITQAVDPSNGLPQYRHGSPIHANGLALSMDKTWGGGARLRASVSLQDAHYTGGGDLPNSPKALAKLNWSTPLPWAGIRLAYEARAESGRISLGGQRLGGYAMSNLRLSGGLGGPGTEWSLHIGNLLDKRYAQPGSGSNWQNALDQDGRSVRAEIVHRF